MNYEELSRTVVQSFKKCYKLNVAFALNKVPKAIQKRLLEDENFNMEIEAVKAKLYIDQLNLLQDVIDGQYADSEKPTDRSAVVLKALEMKQKLLLSDFEEKDTTNVLNIQFEDMQADDISKLETVEVHKGSSSADLGADFGAGDDDDDSFEAKLKKDVLQKLKDKEENND